MGDSQATADGARAQAAGYMSAGATRIFANVVDQKILHRTIIFYLVAVIHSPRLDNLIPFLAFAMTFFGMFMSRVDPFAVYAAERELAKHGRSVRRNVLVSHYLLRGQLRTLVRNLIAARDNEQLEKAIAAAIIEGPNESANPRFVAPLLTGLGYSAGVIAIVAIDGVLRFARSGLQVESIDWRWPSVIGMALIALCMTYAFLGAQIGRVKASKTMSIILGLALVGFIFWLTRYLDHAR